LEHRCDVIKLAYEIGCDDEVEALVGNCHRLCIAHAEVELWMVLARDLDDLGRDIEANAMRRPQRREQVSSSTAELQHAGGRRDDGLQVALDIPVVVEIAPVPIVTLQREPVVVIPGSILRRAHAVAALGDTRGHGQPSIVGDRLWALRPALYCPGVHDRSQVEREHFNRLAETIGGVWRRSKTAAGQVRLEERGRIAIRNALLQAGCIALEAGVGNGDFTIRIARSGATIIGIDVSPKQAALARARVATFSNVTVQTGDIAHLDFPDNYFDAVVGQSVLHHLDLEQCLPELRRVLKHGGRFFFFEPNMLNPQVAIEKNVKPIGRRVQNSPGETALFRWQIVSLLERHGYRNVWARPFDFLHPATPMFLVALVHAVSKIAGTLPVVREIGGSLQIHAVK